MESPLFPTGFTTRGKGGPEVAGPEAWGLGVNH